MATTDQKVNKYFRIRYDSGTVAKRAELNLYF